MTIADKGLELVTVRVILVSVPPKLARIQGKKIPELYVEKTRWIAEFTIHIS